MTRFCIRHRRLVLLAWLALVAALAAGAAAFPPPLATGFTLNGSESERAAALLGDAPAEPRGTLVVSAPAGVESPPAREAVTALIARMNTRRRSCCTRSGRCWPPPSRSPSGW